MRTEQKTAAWCAIALFVQLCVLHSLPYGLNSGAANLWRTLVCAGIVLLAWVACDGNRLLRLLFPRRAA